MVAGFASIEAKGVAMTSDDLMTLRHACDRWTNDLEKLHRDVCGLAPTAFDVGPILDVIGTQRGKIDDAKRSASVMFENQFKGPKDAS